MYITSKGGEKIEINFILKEFVDFSLNSFIDCIVNGCPEKVEYLDNQGGSMVINGKYCLDKNDTDLFVKKLHTFYNDIVLNYRIRNPSKTKSGIQSILSEDPKINSLISVLIYFMKINPLEKFISGNIDFLSNDEYVFLNQCISSGPFLNYLNSPEVTVLEYKQAFKNAYIEILKNRYGEESLMSTKNDGTQFDDYNDFPKVILGVDDPL